MGFWNKEVHEIIKEVPVEKIVIKEVIREVFVPEGPEEVWIYRVEECFNPYWLNDPNGLNSGIVFTDLRSHQEYRNINFLTPEEAWNYSKETNLQGYTRKSPVLDKAFKLKDGSYVSRPNYYRVEITTLNKQTETEGN
jgi:hypothetical protein